MHLKNLKRILTGLSVAAKLKIIVDLIVDTRNIWQGTIIGTSTVRKISHALLPYYLRPSVLFQGKLYLRRQVNFLLDLNVSTYAGYKIL